jgi:signal transduction histidine kinase/CheY-like chemotaxis protein
MIEAHQYYGPICTLGVECYVFDHDYTGFACCLGADKLRLRTKFLLSLVAVIAGLTCATLFVVQRSAQQRVRREVQEEALNAVLTFRVLQHDHEVTLRRKADLLALMASMRNGDPTSIQDVGEDPWQSDECHLLSLANREGKIVALHSTLDEFPVETAQAKLSRTLEHGDKTAWWYSGRRLYQVVIEPFYEGATSKGTLLGNVVVGRGIDPIELGRVSTSQIALRIGDDIVSSTLNPLRERELAQHLAPNGSMQENVQIDGERFFAQSVDLTTGVQPVSILVLKSYSAAFEDLQKQNRLLAGLGFAAILVGVAFAFVVSDRFTRPLGHLVEGVHALERDDYEYALELRGADEVADVTRAFDRMRKTLKSNESQKRELENQLRQAQKMEAVGRLAGGVAHDFNNLLTVIKGHGDLILDRLQPGEPLHLSAQQIDKAADRAASLTRQLLAFSRMQVLQPKVLDLNTLVSEMSGLLKRLIREDISFSLRAGESLGRVKADPGQIEQVIMNLIVNACDAMPRGGRLTVETGNVSVDQAFARARPPMLPGPYVRLVVEDTGHGMDAETRLRIFEPFFTTKELGQGTGLGLATVYGVVKQSGGCIWVESEPDKGARFEVYFPLCNEPEERVRPTRSIPASAHRAETVLIVEDEEAVRELASEFMKSAGYTVLTASDGQQAIAIVEAGKCIDVLLTDVVMPKMRGPELAKRLKALQVEAKIIYMSGYLEYNSGNGEFLEDGFFLQKPFTRETLVRKVNETLAAAPSSPVGNHDIRVPSGSRI